MERSRLSEEQFIEILNEHQTAVWFRSGLTDHSFAVKMERGCESMRPPSAKAEEGASDFAWMLGTLRTDFRIAPRRTLSLSNGSNFRLVGTF